MKIRDIPVESVRHGTNWRLVKSEDADTPIEDWQIEAADHFAPSDEVVYSGISVLKTGEVRPIVMVKEVQYTDYWGDTCAFVNGAWRDVGFDPDPNAAPTEEYIANPLPHDPSFVGEYSHEWHQRNFQRFVNRI